MLCWVTIKSSLLYFCTAWWNDRAKIDLLKIHTRGIGTWSYVIYVVKGINWNTRKGDALKGNLIGVNLSLQRLWELRKVVSNGNSREGSLHFELLLWLSHDKSIKDEHF